MTLENDEYHADASAISQTQIKLFKKSPREYYESYITRTMTPGHPKRATEIGAAVHAILLENTNVEDCIAIYPDECFKKSSVDGSPAGLHPKKAAEFREANPYKSVLKQPDADIVCRICMEVYGHQLGAVLREPGGHFEEPVYCTDAATGLSLKCKPDWFCDMGSYILCYDLKTTERPEPWEWRRVSRNFAYWLQHVHYSSVLMQKFGKPVQYVFWAIETKPPYRIAPYIYPDSFIDEAYGNYRLVLQQLAACYASGDWTDRWTKQTNIIETTQFDLDSFGMTSEIVDGGDSDGSVEEG